MTLAANDNWQVQLSDQASSGQVAADAVALVPAGGGAGDSFVWRPCPAPTPTASMRNGPES